jgi:hypothetical protein
MSADTSTDAAEHEWLRRVLLCICTAVYLAGMGGLVVIGADRPVEAVLNAPYALLAFCCISFTCLVAMVLYVRKVPLASQPDNHGGP